MLNRPVPLYHQLRELLTQQIESGQWGPGHQLPTEMALSAEFGVSRATVRLAMQILQNQGLIDRFPARGTFVARPKISHNLLDMYVSAKDFSSAGSLPHTTVHSVRRTAPPPNVVARLALTAGQDVWELQRIVLADNEPNMLITSWLPFEDFPGLDKADFNRQSMRAFLRDCHGIEGGRQHKEIEATVLDDTEAELLKAAPGTPAFLFTHLTSTNEGRPYEYRKMVVRGDRSKYHVDLEEPEPLV